mgnify:CR=1 FL=1
MHKRVAMARTRRLQDILDELSSYLVEGATAPSLDTVTARLSHRNSYVVSKAAAVAGRHALEESVGPLRDAFGRMCSGGTKADKGCLAKKAIVKALDRLGHDDTQWFIDASRCVQAEPVYGGTVDTATDVRCGCIRAMTRFDWGRVCHALARLTGDREPKVRMAAVDALCAFGNREAELIVLTRTMAGDSSEEVMGVCFRALIAFDRETYLDLVAEHLMRGDDAVRVEAAFALAESRAPEAFEILHGAWEEESGTDMRRSLLLAIGMLRTPGAAALLAGHLNDSRFGEIARETLESYPAELREGTRSG